MRDEKILKALRNRPHPDEPTYEAYQALMECLVDDWEWFKEEEAHTGENFADTNIPVSFVKEWVEHLDPEVIGLEWAVEALTS